MESGNLNSTYVDITFESVAKTRGDEVSKSEGARQYVARVNFCLISGDEAGAVSFANLGHLSDHGWGP